MAFGHLLTQTTVEPVLTLSQLAALLSVNVQTPYDLRSKGRGPRGFRVGWSGSSSPGAGI